MVQNSPTAGSCSAVDTAPAQNAASQQGLRAERMLGVEGRRRLSSTSTSSSSTTYNGWYDVSNCGTCGDYCAWLGTSSGGDPRHSRIDAADAGAYWACYVRGHTSAAPRNAKTSWTASGAYTSWTWPRCSKQGEVLETGAGTVASSAAFWGAWLGLFAVMLIFKARRWRRSQIQHQRKRLGLAHLRLVDDEAGEAGEAGHGERSISLSAECGGAGGETRGAVDGRAGGAAEGQSEERAEEQNTKSAGSRGGGLFSGLRGSSRGGEGSRGSRGSGARGNLSEPLIGSLDAGEAGGSSEGGEGEEGGARRVERGGWRGRLRGLPLPNNNRFCRATYRLACIFVAAGMALWCMVVVCSLVESAGGALPESLAWATPSCSATRCANVQSFNRSYEADEAGKAAEGMHGTNVEEEGSTLAPFSYIVASDAQLYWCVNLA